MVGNRNKDTKDCFHWEKRTSRIFIPWLEKYYRLQFIGEENIPDKPFLAVGNHLGVYFMPEAFLWVGKYHLLPNKPPMKVLVHSVIHKISKILHFPDYNFGILDARPESAVNALKNGNAVTVYPGGDRDNTKSFCKRNKIDFFEHYGYIQTAIKAQVPIVPIVGVGGGETLFVLSSGEKIAQKIGLTKNFKIHSWPIYWSFPFGWHMGHFPYFSIPVPSQVIVSVLPPVSIEGISKDDIDNPIVLKQMSDKIQELMQQEMDRLTKGRIPVIGKIGTIR